MVETIGFVCRGLCSWLLAASVQLAIATLVVALLARFVGRASHALAHALWLLVFAKAMLPTTLSTSWSAGGWCLGQIGTTTQRLFGLAHDPIRALHTGLLLDPTWEREHFAPPPAVLWDGTAAIVTSLSIALVAIWLGGMLIYLANVAIAQVSLARQLRAARFVSRGPIAEQLRGLATELGLRSAPRLFLCQRAQSPFLCGIVRPTVVLPAGLPGMMSPEELRLVLLHELIHARRHDLAVCWLQVLIEGVFWFHPAIWYANHRLAAERELCVDAAVLEHGSVVPARYGEAILRVAEALVELQPSRTATVALVNAQSASDELRERLVALFDGPRESKQRRQMAYALALLVGTQLLPLNPEPIPEGAPASAPSIAPLRPQ
jgi:beta-lactamase regulating signal transducer with metallopeptidase domain